MEAPWWVSLLVSWLPFIALIAVWIFLSRRIQTRGPWVRSADLCEQHLAEVKRTNTLLEQIAVALEKRAGT